MYDRQCPKMSFYKGSQATSPTVFYKVARGQSFKGSTADLGLGKSQDSLPQDSLNLHHNSIYI